MNEHLRTKPLARSLRIMLLAGLAWSSGAALADLADIAREPLAASNGAAIRPNLMFILDDSGSMDSDFLPETANYRNACFGDKNFNRLAYDPARTYVPPVRSDGTPYPEADFYDAFDDGFDADSDDANLSTVADLHTPAITFRNANNNTVTSRFYYSTGRNNARCGDNDTFTVVYRAQNIAAPTGVDPLSNYANWYSYYRTRMLTMRTAAGRAFANINPTRFRVGFSTIHSNAVEDGLSNGFLNIRDFDAANQKTTFYSLLYGSEPGGGTPLRSALARAGRYYANKLPSQPLDPVQYSCQRNYSILSTDGYWNTDANDGGWNTALGGGRIGNQDGTGASPAVAPPQLDSGNRSTTLADVAMYYFKTDLRTPTLSNCSVVRDGATVDVCTNDVAPVRTVPEDVGDWQHMNTITLGLGVSGELNYTSSNYNSDTDPQSDFFKIKNGTKAWPNPMDAEDGHRIDDLWHAAVNGGGIYYSAGNPSELSAGLAKALNSIDASKGSGTAAATSNLRPVEGDNAVFIASYYSNYWDGDIKAQTIDPNTGLIGSTVTWSARAQLANKTAATRNIYFLDAASSNRLASFEYANLPQARKADFDNLCPTGGGTLKLSQCLNLSDAQKSAITGAKVVDFLRGDRTNEAQPNSTSPLFRYRYNDTEKYHNVLGDIVNSIPVYVKKPGFRYVDPSYASFVSSMADRKGVVYAGANDGMLHAFDASTGAELWAYVPTVVMPRLHKLADTNYATRHEYFVDGSPVVGDVKGADGWRTILVGGLNAGGRAYYALDVTDPDNPRALWEYTDTDLGLSFGNPVISQTKDGTWVVIFSSGYNNVSSGDGNGHLYVVNALTGARIGKVPTAVGGVAAGSSATPSNLGRINAWVDDETLNMTAQVYGGDMQGNLWRFDIGDASASNWTAVRLGRAAAPGAGGVQPITVKPELTEISSGGAKYRLVSVGTGRYLGSLDVASTQTQSIYVVKDAGGSTGLGVLRDDPKMVAQTISSFTAPSTGTTARRIATPVAVDWATASGWYVDLTLTGGERVDVEMQQQLTRLTVATNAPDPNACSLSGASGSSWLYIFDLTTGAAPSTAVDGAVAIRLGNTLTAGITTIQVASGNTKTIVVSRGGDTSTNNDPVVAASASQLRRTSWRELMN